MAKDLRSTVFQMMEQDIVRENKQKSMEDKKKNSKKKSEMKPKKDDYGKKDKKQDYKKDAARKNRDNNKNKSEKVEGYKDDFKVKEDKKFKEEKKPKSLVLTINILTSILNIPTAIAQRIIVHPAEISVNRRIIPIKLQITPNSLNGNNFLLIVW